nr:hypothetical protein [uncultured Desulfobulbus sp.]
MPKVMLGDNPFFGISHLAPSKSEQYLKDNARWDKAVEIIKEVPKLGIDSFMVSSHKDTKQLLDAAGYANNTTLPEICLVVPNVHELNTNAASRGIIGALKFLFGNIFSLSNILPRRVYERVVMGNIVYPRSTYVALHNVVVDMLIGLRSAFLLKAFCSVTRYCGYKPVLITFNPIKLISLGVRCSAICCYYNKRRYNVCDEPSITLDAFENCNCIDEIWAMGIVASGVITSDELIDDPILQRFSRVLVASTKFERIESLSKVLLSE